MKDRFTVNEIALFTALKIDTLRSYFRRGKIKKPSQDLRGYFYYTLKDAREIIKIIDKLRTKNKNYFKKQKGRK